MQARNASVVGRATRGASKLGLGALAVLLAASGCNDEVGGDGYVPPRASAGKSGLGGGAGALGDGGMSPEGGTAGEPASSGAKAGSTNHAGSGGKGGRGGTGSMTDGGTGGEPTGAAVCGNNATEAGEECDDGNTQSGDGCSADCKSGCEVCENTFCKAVRAHEAGEHGWLSEDLKFSPADLPTTCYDMPGLAEGGPAQGVARADLCQSMVDCIRRERCAQIAADDVLEDEAGGVRKYSAASQYAFMHCFCTQEVTSNRPTFINSCTDPVNFDPSKTPNFIGKCKQEIQEASERDDLGIFGGLYTLAKPLGVANSLLQWCDKRLCTEECLPEASVGVVAQITADILQTKNLAGESALGDLIADAYRSATGADFAFVNDAAFISDYAALGLVFNATPGRSADANGRVLESEIRQVLFGMHPGQGRNDQGGGLLVTAKLTGQQVYDFLEAQASSLQVSGLSFSWDAATFHVTEVKAGGLSIDKASSYTVATNNVLAKLLVGATNVTTTDKNPEQELVKFLQAQPQPIAPPALNRISRAN